MEINRTTDALGRDTGFSLSGSPYAVTYGYDTYGRFHSVSSSVSLASLAVQYSRLPNSDLISGMTASSGFLWTRAYESGRSLITSVENRFGETVISRYDYANDQLGRRVSRADSGLAFAVQPTCGDPATVEMPAYNAYSYNTRSEVTGAARRWGTPDAPGALVLGRQYAYAFDSIGNRITAAEGDTARTASYTANALNQYTQRTVPDEKDLIGTAPTNVAVTVNQNPVSRQSAYWHHALEVDNATDAAYPDVAITAVYNPPGTNDPDVVTSTTGRVFVAQTPEQFLYDDDGNLTQDGRFTYTWDGENRLIAVVTRDDLPAAVPRVMVEYAYDHQSRRIASSSAVWINGSWQAVESRVFLYDGWNVVSELTHTQTHTFTNSYLWGLDLSGSLQGAGGVGGLLAASLDGTTALYCHDANGNVGQLADADGALLAHYEYSPFGETIVSTGPLAKSNPFRFSTKWFDNDTGLGYWGYRWYEPGLGRWLSRDPIGEEAFMRLHEEVVKREIVDPIGTDTDNNGIRVVQDVISLMDVLLASSPNLYGAFINAPVNRVDAFGLKCMIYLMMGHFGGKDEKDKGWLWTQLGTSTAKLGECDGVYSITCHMKSFVDMVGTKVPGVITPKGWPPAPYDDDRKIYCSDVPLLYGQTEAMNTSMAASLKKDAKCCCKEVNFHVMCDEDMKACTKMLVENPKKGIIKPSLESDPCGLDKKY